MWLLPCMLPPATRHVAARSELPQAHLRRCLPIPSTGRYVDEIKAQDLADLFHMVRCMLCTRRRCTAAHRHCC
jgi:hypothetical protein